MNKKFLRKLALVSAFLFPTLSAFAEESAPAWFKESDGVSEVQAKYESDPKTPLKFTMQKLIEFKTSQLMLELVRGYYEGHTENASWKYYYSGLYQVQKLEAQRLFSVVDEASCDGLRVDDVHEEPIKNVKKTNYVALKFDLKRPECVNDENADPRSQYLILKKLPSGLFKNVYESPIIKGALWNLEAYGNDIRVNQVRDSVPRKRKAFDLTWDQKDQKLLMQVDFE